MADLMVLTTDEQSFLDRVVDYGVDHGLLTLDRLKALARNCDDFHPNLCAALNLNEWETGETLRAAEIARKLLNLALEEQSCSDIAVAVRILNRQLASELIASLLNQISAGVDRLVGINERIATFDTRYGYSVLLAKVNKRVYSSDTVASAKESSYLDLSDLYLPREKQERTLTVCERWQSLRDFKEWLAKIASFEFEERVSQKFLPWGSLAREADLQPLGKEAIADVAEGMIIWDADSLIITLVFNLLGWGEARTVVPYQQVAKLPRLVRKIKVFLTQAKEKFAAYLASLPLAPNQQETACLWQMFDSAMQTLQKEIFEQGLLGAGLCRWFYLIHIEATSKVFFDSFAKNDMAVEEEKHPAEELLRLIELDEPTDKIVRRLKRINWSKMIDEGFADTLLQHLGADTILRHVPLTPEVISRICAFWKTKLGQQAWKPRQRRCLAQAVLPLSFTKFWRHLPTEATQALAEAYPEKSEWILSKTA